MDQQVLVQEGEYLEGLRAGAATCVARNAFDEVEELLFLDMLGMA